MINLPLSALYIIIFVQCIELSVSMSKFCDIVKNFRTKNGIARERDSLDSYSYELDDFATEQLRNRACTGSTASYHLLPEAAAILGSTDYTGSEYAEEHYEAIVRNLAKDGKSDFLLDEAYKYVAIVFDKSNSSGRIRYCIIFSLPKDDVNCSIASRICKYETVEQNMFGPFDRLSSSIKFDVAKIANRIVNNQKDTGFDSNIHTMVDAKVPQNIATSWKGIVQYLISGENEAGNVAARDPNNYLVGMDFEWKMYNSAKAFESLRVVLVFEKLITTGKNSGYETILLKLKKGRTERKVQNDLLVDVYPTEEANKSAEKRLDGDESNASTAILGKVKYSDAERKKNSCHMQKEFEKVVCRWFERANKSDGNEMDQKIANKLFYGEYTGIGFAAKVLADQEGTPYWNFCVFFVPKSASQ